MTWKLGMEGYLALGMATFLLLLLEGELPPRWWMDRGMAAVKAFIKIHSVCEAEVAS